MKLEHKYTTVTVNGVGYFIFKQDAFTQLRWEARIVKMLVGEDASTITDLLEKFKGGKFSGLKVGGDEAASIGLQLMTDIFNGLIQNDTELVATFIKEVCESSVKIASTGDDLDFNTAFDEKVHDCYRVFFEVLKFNFGVYFLESSPKQSATPLKGGNGEA